jgi:hypothetical protein
MPQLSIIGPCPMLDLGNKGRLSPDDDLPAAAIFDRCRFDFQRVERPSQIDCLALLKPVPIDPM